MRALKYLLGLFIWPIFVWPEVKNESAWNRTYLVAVFGTVTVCMIFSDALLEPELLNVRHLVIDHLSLYFLSGILAREFLKKDKDIRIF